MVIFLIHSTYPGCVKHVLRPDNDRHLNSGWVVKHSCYCKSSDLKRDNSSQH